MTALNVRILLGGFIGLLFIVEESYEAAAGAPMANTDFSNVKVRRRDCLTFVKDKHYNLKVS